MWGCQLCGRQFAHRTGQRRHLREVHGVGIQAQHPCNLCPKTFKRAEGLRVHLHGLHGLGPGFQCPQCQRNFTTAGRWWRSGWPSGVGLSTLWHDAHTQSRAATPPTGGTSNRNSSPTPVQSVPSYIQES